MGNRYWCEKCGFSQVIDASQQLLNQVLNESYETRRAVKLWSPIIWLG
jgi:hypothetical protein